MYKFGDYIPNAAMAAASMWIVRRFLGTFCEKKERSFLSVSAWILYFVFQIYLGIFRIGKTIRGKRYAFPLSLMVK